VAKFGSHEEDLEMEKIAIVQKSGVARVAFVLAALLIVAGCSGQPLSTREKGTLIGGGLGAATGAIIGAAVGAPGAGAAIGGAMGAGGGFLVGNQMQNTETQQKQTQGQLQQQQQQIEHQQREIEQLKQQGETE
jgi:osmotically inducible lipoprotein OsmB